MRVATAIERHFRHMLAIDGFADLGIRHLNCDNAIVDLSCLSALPDLQGRVDLQCTVYVNHHSNLLLRLEARRANLQFIPSDRHDRERILPLVVSGCGLFSFITQVVESNCRASNESATGITDHSRDSSCQVGP